MLGTSENLSVISIRKGPGALRDVDVVLEGESLGDIDLKCHDLICKRRIINQDTASKCCYITSDIPSSILRKTRWVGSR